ncbi:hypothetical protein SASPL_152553 [Salvia splendens]|uniref:Receptor-like serine/threonine-protein kinase n=1 Tax=Salvia splendens TaxID=180675 RepID=A0A8X8W3H3_SALSN|nr:hypothetical protein SASPL_152553 [Salvia splendens]
MSCCQSYRASLGPFWLAVSNWSSSSVLSLSAGSVSPFWHLHLGLLISSVDCSPGAFLVDFSTMDFSALFLSRFSASPAVRSFLNSEGNRGIIRATPDAVVWVANRDNPIIDSEEAVLAISINGSLAITKGGSLIIWFATPSVVATSRPLARLLDSGNLVVVDETRDEEDYLWQSSNFPTDTLLPDMKMVDDVEAGVVRNLTSWRNADDPSPGEFVMRIENRGVPEIVILRGTAKWFRTGNWNGLHFNGIPRYVNTVSAEPGLVFRDERLISMSRPYKSTIVIRATLGVSGSVQQYTMNAKRDRWNVVDSFPRDQCDGYGHCGPNAVCKVERAKKCECFKGFIPRFPHDWEVQDWGGGCRRLVALDCEDEHGFLEVRRVKYPDMLEFWLNSSMTLRECRAQCLKNCSCNAYANPYVTNGGRGCVLWFGDLVDTRGLSAANTLQNIYIRLPLQQLDFSTDSEKVDKKLPIKLIAISLAVGVLVASIINGGVVYLTRRRRRVKAKDEDIDVPIIKMANIVEATNNFSLENMLGSGGFGPVYKGQLSTGQHIAVKRLSRTSEQGVEEFKNEVKLIAKLQHRNLVKLVGYENQRMLLTWPKRFDIIMGIARGLLYLQHDSRLKIIHRDLKTGNILLDKNLNPKISDFGLARAFEEDESISRTKRIVGTYGYMAPEYASDGKFSVKSDIFSFGVILLEIVSGKKNRGYEHDYHNHTLLGHAWLLWKDERNMEVMDECLKETCDESQVKRCIHVGLLCVQKLADDRPIMQSVVLMLATDGAILPDPKEPGYFVETSSQTQDSTSPRIELENATITITDLEAR